MTAENPETVEEAIESVATGMVSSSSENGRSVQRVPLRDLIEADKYLAQKNRVAQAHFGLRFTKIIPPGGG